MKYSKRKITRWILLVTVNLRKFSYIYLICLFFFNPPILYVQNCIFFKHNKAGLFEGSLSVYILLLLRFLITFHYTIFWSGWVCIPLSGNIPLRGKFSLHIVYIFRTGWNFLIQFCYSNPSYNRNIVRSLYLKFKIFAHAQITITHYYVLFTYLLTWYELETYIGDTFW